MNVIVGKDFTRRRASLLWDCGARLPELFHPHGAKHCHRSFERHLHRRVPDQLYSPMP
jgi:hypothetical protein